MSVHGDQVESVLKRTVQTVLSRGLNDPRVRGMISVTEVSVSRDLANATISVSVLPETHEELTMHGLRAAATHIRSEVAGMVRMRRVPRLSFKADRALKNMAAVEAAIEEARRERGPADTRAAEPPQESQP